MDCIGDKIYEEECRELTASQEQVVHVPIQRGHEDDWPSRRV